MKTSPKDAQFIADCILRIMLPYPSRSTPSKETNVLCDFIYNFMRNMHLEIDIAIIALLYLHRVRNRLAETNRLGLVTVPMLTSLFFGAVVCAHKANNDSSYRLSTWGRAGGLVQTEALRLERQFMALANFDFYISRNEYRSWTAFVEDMRGRSFDMHLVPCLKRQSSNQDFSSVPNINYYI